VENSDITSSLPEATLPPLFREVQRIQPVIFWLPIMIATGAVWYEFFQQVVLGHQGAAKSMPNWLAWVFLVVFGLGLPALGLVVRMITEIRPGELWVRVAPSRGVHVPVQVIGSATVREYSPIREYGGWGARMSRRNGRAYNARGYRGVQLVLQDGDGIMVGSQRADELLAALRSAGATLEPVQSRPKSRRKVTPT
jgi:hypothetical protein